MVVTRENGIETIRYAFRQPGRRRIHGIASTPRITTHKVSRSSENCAVKFPVPLRCSHSEHGRGLGDVTLVRRSEAEVYIQADIHDSPAGDYAWKLIEQGELLGLSKAPLTSTSRRKSTT